MKIGAVCIESGEYKTIDHTSNNISDWVMASSAMPVFFPAQEIDGNKYMDGGVREMAPLQDAINLGAKEIDVILTDPLGSIDSSYGNIIKQIQNLLNIMFSEVVKDDLKLTSNNIKINII
jgi:NTE family protein